MPNFLESKRFPDNIARGVVFGPEFVTTITTTESGDEFRNRIRSRALCRGECSHSVKTEEQYKELLTFFRSVGGKFSGFRFRDWSDYTCTTSEGILKPVDLATPNIFQLYKLYEADTLYKEERKILKPIASTIKIFESISGELTDITSSTSLDETTGVVTITGFVIDNEYYWSGEFDIPCRFDTDRMAASMTHHGVYTWDQIPIVELRTV